MPPNTQQSRRHKAARLGEIAQAALEEFSLHGFAEARLDQVAKRAGISKGTIYLYYASKEALFIAVIRTYLSPVLEQIEIAVQQAEGSVEDKLHRMLTAFYQQVAGNPERRHIIRLIICEGPKFPELLTMYYDEIVSRGIRFIRALLANSQQQSRLSAQPVSDFPQLIIGPIILAALWKILFDTRETLDLDALVEAHLKVLLDGIRLSP